MSDQGKMSKNAVKCFMKGNATEIGVFGLLLALVIAASIASDVFRTYQNISSICSQLSYYGVIAAGAAVVMIMGGLDMSQMSAMTIGIVTSGQILLSGVPGAAIWAILVALVCGMVCGAINGCLVALLRIEPMIATIGTQYIFRAIAFVIVTGQSYWIDDKTFKYIGFNSFAGLPVLLWIMLVVFVVIWAVMKYTQFGQNVYAIGSNENSARLSGIHVKKTKLGAYTVTGITSGIAGVLWMAQLSASKPTAGEGSELIPIAAVVIGGVSLTGGKGKVPGVLIGVLLLMILSNIMTLLHFNTYLQQLFQGLILIIAVIVGTPRGGKLDI